VKGGTAGVGVIVLFAGYTLTYYGMSQLTGGNWGLLDLMVPSRWAKARGTPRDNGKSISPQAAVATKTAGVVGSIVSLPADVLSWLGL